MNVRAWSCRGTKAEPRTSEGSVDLASTNSGDLDDVGPGDQERRVVLPLQGDFEEISSRAVRLAVDEGDSGL